MFRQIRQLILSGLLLILGGHAMAAKSQFYFNSDPGDYIGAGQEVLYTDLEGTFSAQDTYGNGIQMSFITPGYEHWWYLEIAPVSGPLQVGVYEQAQRWPFQDLGHPGLSVSGEGRGCNTLTGTFRVLEIARDPATGTLTALAFDYEQHCEGFQAAMFGQFRYNSSVPVTGKPMRIKLTSALNSQGCLEASSPTGAVAELTTPDVTDVNGGNAVRYEWTTSTGVNAAGQNFSFLAPIRATVYEPVIVTLTVTDLISSQAKTVTRSLCVSDTAPPVITIVRPLPGEVFYGDDLPLDVIVKDAVDTSLTSFEVFTGSSFKSPLNPTTGRSRQQVIDRPRTDGSISTTITVRAADASGNRGEQSVTVTRFPNGNKKK